MNYEKIVRIRFKGNDVKKYILQEFGHEDLLDQNDCIADGEWEHGNSEDGTAEFYFYSYSTRLNIMWLMKVTDDGKNIDYLCKVIKSTFKGFKYYITDVTEKHNMIKHIKKEYDNVISTPTHISC